MGKCPTRSRREAAAVQIHIGSVVCSVVASFHLCHPNEWITALILDLWSLGQKLVTHFSRPSI
jgi:hypothetical protein